MLMMPSACYSSCLSHLEAREDQSGQLPRAHRVDEVHDALLPRDGRQLLQVAPRLVDSKLRLLDDLDHLSAHVTLRGEVGPQLALRLLVREDEAAQHVDGVLLRSIRWRGAQVDVAIAWHGET